MAIIMWILCSFIIATAIAHDDIDDFETKAKPKFQNARHLKYDGTIVLQPDDNIITVDRVRALLRNGFSSVQVGNRTFAANAQRIDEKPKNTTKSIRKSTEDDVEDDEDVTRTVVSKDSSKGTTVSELRESTKISRSLKSRLTQSLPSQATVSGFIIEENEEDDDEDEEELRKLKEKETVKFTGAQKSSPNVNPRSENDERHENENGTPLKRLQAQFKKIQSAAVRNASDDGPKLTLPNLITTTQEPPPTSPNLLEQLFHNFALFAKPASPPPSPFLVSDAQSKIAKPTVPASTTASTQGTSTTVSYAEVTIPFIETTVTTTEAPMLPPEADYILASKQLQPFVSGVKQLESESTREALDTASQMGKLTWLVNYAINQQQNNR